MVVDDRLPIQKLCDALILGARRGKTKGWHRRTLQLVKYRMEIDGPANFVRGSRQIDAVWVTPDVEISAACFLPFFFGVGDHRAILLDIPQHLLIGGKIHNISRPNARGLQCNRHKVQQKYNNDLEPYCAKHRIQKKYIHYSYQSILQRKRQP